MALTLTQTADLTKKAFIFGVIFLVLIIFSWVGFQYYKASQVVPTTVEEDKADTKFNLLPKPNFNISLVPSSKYTFELLTTTGKLPADLPKIFKVYFISKLGTSLLASNKAKELSSSLNFNNGPEIISSTLYNFTDDSGGKISIDLDTGNFEYKRNEATESGLLDNTLSDKPKLIQDFKTFLNSKGLSKEQISSGHTQVLYPENSNNKAVISLWQDNITEGETEIKVVTNNFNAGLIKAEVSNIVSEDNNRYPYLKYIYWPIDLTNFATYPLKDINVAFEELKMGKASVVKESSLNTVGLTNIYIAYLLSEKYTPYLQPIYVFEGEDFTALVGAVDEQYLEKE